MEATTTIRPTFGQAIKAGFIVGAISAVANNIWNMIAQALGSVPPPDFMIAVTMSSIMPTLFGAILYFLLTKYFSNGKMIFTIVSVLFLLVSLFPTFSTTLPDGSPAGEGFTLLTLPMHLIAGGLAIWGIPKFAK